jgi:hypothetical protein
MTDADVQLLDFEHHHPMQTGTKDVLIREVFDCSPTLYHQRLNVLLDDPEALVYNPQMVNRLRRLRDRRRRSHWSA